MINERIIFLSPLNRKEVREMCLKDRALFKAQRM
jgi:hypothetical protein